MLTEEDFLADEPTQFQVGVKIRTFNYKLEEAIKAAQARHGGITRANFCKEFLRFEYNTLASYLSFKAFPSEERILEIAIALEVAPSEIFPEEISDLRLTKQPEAIPVSLEQAKALGFGELPALDEDDELDKILLPTLFKKLLGTLKPVEARVLELRYGLYGGKSMTLKEVGEVMGWTGGTRAQQVEAKALRRLRHPSRSRQLGNPDQSRCSYVYEAQGERWERTGVGGTWEFHANDDRACGRRADLTAFNGSLYCPAHLYPCPCACHRYFLKVNHEKFLYGCCEQTRTRSVNRYGASSIEVGGAWKHHEILDSIPEDTDA